MFETLIYILHEALNFSDSPGSIVDLDKKVGVPDLAIKQRKRLSLSSAPSREPPLEKAPRSKHQAK